MYEKATIIVILLPKTLCKQGIELNKKSCPFLPMWCHSIYSMSVCIYDLRKHGSGNPCGIFQLWDFLKFYMYSSTCTESSLK